MVPVLEMQSAKHLIGPRYGCSLLKIHLHPEQYPLIPKELQNTSCIVSFKLGHTNRHLVVPDKNIQKIRYVGTKSETQKC